MSGIKFSELKKYEISLTKIDELFEQDKITARKELESSWSKLKKEHNVTPKEIEQYASEKGKLRKYLLERVFPSEAGGYYIVQNGQVILKSREGWAMIENKILCKSKELAKILTKDIVALYKSDITNSEYAIDTKNHIINLALPMNFSYSGKKKLGKNAEKMRNFMFNVICGGNMEQWKCLRYFIGCMLHRKQSEIVLFLKGLGGIGKTFFVQIIEGMLGKSFTSPNDDVITGEDKFNQQMVGASCVLVEETDGLGKNTKLMKSLKRLSTSKTMVYRKMFKEGEDVPNLMNFIVLSNYVDIDVGDRRVFMTDIDNKYLGDNEYFADLTTCRTPEAFQELFDDLYDTDVKTYMKVPTNQTKEDYKVCTMRLSVKFIVDRYMLKHQYDHLELKISEAYSEYVKLAKQTNEKVIVTLATFSDDVRNYVPKVEVDGKPKQKDHTNVYDFSINTLKDRFINRCKVFSEDRFKEMQLEYEANNNCVEDEDVVDVFDNKLKIENETLRKKIEELEKLLKEKEQEFEDFVEFVECEEAFRQTEAKVEKPKWQKDLTKDFDTLRKYI